MTQSLPQNFGRRPPRMSITNVVTTDTLEAQYNPETLEETFGANYAKLTVPGLSHQVKHFVHTDDVPYSFELFEHALESGHTNADAVSRMKEARRFLRALTHPWRAEGIKRGGAPRALFIWPNLISLTCVLTKCTIKHATFNSLNEPVLWRANVTLEEIRDEFVSMEDILENGTGDEL